MSVTAFGHTNHKAWRISVQHLSVCWLFWLAGAVAQGLYDALQSPHYVQVYLSGKLGQLDSY